MKGDGVSLRELGDSQHGALVDVLERVRAEYRARGALLAEACGRPLAAAGHGCQADLDGFASLAASAMAASCGLARMIGEQGTSLCLQRGDQDLVRLEPAGDLIVVLVLEAASVRGLEGVRARLRLQRALTDIRSILAEPQTNRDLDGIEAGELDALLGPITATTE